MTAEPSFVGTPTSPPDHVLMLGLGAAIAYGALAHGGFFRGEDLTVLLLVVVAATAARMLLRRPSPAFVLVSGAALLALAIVVDRVRPAQRHPSCRVAGSNPRLRSRGGRLVRGRPRRFVLQSVVLASGVVVAFTGWLGVALHIEPLAMGSAGLFRATSTLTYTNATAAFLVMTLVLAVAVLPPNWPRLSLLTVFALLLGLVATMSRGGLITPVLVVLVLFTSCRYRARLRAMWPVLPATAVAVIGFLPGGHCRGRAATAARAGRPRRRTLDLAARPSRRTGCCNSRSRRRRTGGVGQQARADRLQPLHLESLRSRRLRGTSRPRRRAARSASPSLSPHSARSPWRPSGDGGQRPARPLSPSSPPSRCTAPATSSGTSRCCRCSGWYAPFR